MAYRYKNIKLNGRTVLEHRYIWEQFYGTIPKGFEIHHINGNGRDNRLANLELKAVAEHRHQHAATGKHPCIIPGCGKYRESNGYCKMHWYRWKRTGDPMGLRGHSSTNPQAIP